MALDGREDYCQVRNNLTASRTQVPRQINQPSKTKKQSVDGVTGGVTKMAEKKMAAPTLTSMEDELNVAVCSIPSTPQDSMASTEEPSTHSPANTMTDHSPEGEWKEVVSKKKLSMSPRKPASPAKMKEDSSMGLGRKSPLPLPKKPRVRLPLQEPGREKLITAKGREYPLHKKYMISMSWLLTSCWTRPDVSSSGPTDYLDRKRMFSRYFAHKISL